MFMYWSTNEMWKNLLWIYVNILLVEMERVEEKSERYTNTDKTL